MSTGSPAPALICMYTEQGISPSLPSARSRTFCTVTFVPTQGGAPTADAKCHCYVLLFTSGLKTNTSLWGDSSAAWAVGSQRGQRQRVWTLPQHPRTAGSVHNKQANCSCQPPQHVPQRGQGAAVPSHPQAGSQTSLSIGGVGAQAVLALHPGASPRH